MTIDLGKLGWLLIVWAFFIGLALVGFNLPTLLISVGSALYLFR